MLQVCVPEPDATSTCRSAPFPAVASLGKPALHVQSTVPKGAVMHPGPQTHVEMVLTLQLCMLKFLYVLRESFPGC